MSNHPKYLLFVCLLAFGMASCVQVKEYQKAYLNDKDMALNKKEIKTAETTFQSYREATSGGDGGKTGGGCGCN